MKRNDKVYLLNPFVFAKFGIECALLERSQLERESRAQLLQAHFLRVPEYVAVMAKKNEISLIVKRYTMASFVLWIMRKQRRKRTTNL